MERDEEIIQMVTANDGWYAHYSGSDPEPWIEHVMCWAVIKNNALQTTYVDAITLQAQGCIDTAINDSLHCFFRRYDACPKFLEEQQEGYHKHSSHWGS